VEIRGGKRFRTKAERRQIVEETLKPGSSVARVARAHDVNANQVFHWRRQYRQGCFDEADKKSTALVPVRITGGIEKKPASAQQRVKAIVPATGTIDIDLGHARVRIDGAADPDCIRAALEGLVR
jgi:transposase